MEKVTGKSTDSIRLTLTVALCLMSFVAGAAYTKADLWMTMRNIPVIKTPVITQPPPDERKAITASERSSPVELASLASPLALNENAGARDSEPGQEPADEWHTVRMRVTAYCPCPRCCGQYADGMTACGHRIEAGDTFVAADRRYAFGTEMMVPGYSRGQSVKVLDEDRAFRQIADPKTKRSLADQAAAFEGNKGALLLAVSAADGKTLAKYDLDSPPVFDGMAAAGGRLYTSTVNGEVLCFGEDK